jgi:hypothetical protein
MDSVFGLHHVAHAHNAEVGVDALGGHDARTMRDAGRAPTSTAPGPARAERAPTSTASPE